MVSLMIAGHSRQAVLLLPSHIHNLCGIIDVCILLHFAYQTNSFLDNYEPEDDTPSEMDDDTLNSTLARKGKKRQKHFLHEDLIILQQEQMEAHREQEERNRMFFIRLWKTKSLRSFAFGQFTLLLACCTLRISLSFRKT